MKHLLLVKILVLVFISWNLEAQTDKYSWVDSVFNTMSQDQKIGQLFMMRAYSKNDVKEQSKIVNLIQQYHIGGLCFFQGNPAQVATLGNLYQAKSKIPLMVSIDGEWGLGMRFPDDAVSFPKQLTLGAIQDDQLIEEFGNEVAKQLKRLGIHVNFAPVVDVNSNASNPVINDRSFGEDKYNVASKSYHYAKGMQDYGILACAKHFPGHGDTDVDSHYDLPVIKHSRLRLEDLELYPFRILSNQGISSFMVAHLHIPAIDDRRNRPTTLSKIVVNDMLREDLGFQGLIFTDALEMRGVTKHFTGGMAEAEALMAGNDVLLLSENIDAAFKKIKLYISEGKILQSRVDESVKRILSAKYDVGLTKTPYVDPYGIESFVNGNPALAMKSKLIEKSITLVADDQDQVPISDVSGSKFATLSIGSTKRNAFQDRLDGYANFDHFNTPSQMSETVKQTLITNLKKYDKVIIGLHHMNKSVSKNYGLNASIIQLVKSLDKSTKVILCVFGSPYALKNFEDMGTVVMAYEDDEMFQDITAQSLFGVNSMTGKLPVTASDAYYAGLGITRPSTQKLGYSLPERVGLNSLVLNEIDQLASSLIADKSAPGCQVLIAKDGKIVFDKAYGYFTYDQQNPVTVNTVYDLASLTKILSTTLAVMRLKDENKLSLYDRLETKVPQASGTNKEGMLIGDMLAHVAGLFPWIAFYDRTMVVTKKKTTLNPSFYANQWRDSFGIQISNELFLRDDWRDSVFQIIFDSNLRDARNYRYSDLGFYLTAKAIENITRNTLDLYMFETFYKPLGLKWLTYKPLNRIPIEYIAPTEKDDYWRMGEVRGHVHDMGAAMLGGVAGHAGLFGNARDVAVIMQMLLNYGSYGGKTLIRPETIRDFTTRHPSSTRRGYGFDLKELNPARTENMSPYASEWTFGHTGFTGTATYVDPVHNIVFVFLCNRTYPSMKNNKLHSKDYRPRIQSVIYKALMQGV